MSQIDEKVLGELKQAVGKVVDALLRNEQRPSEHVFMVHGVKVHVADSDLVAFAASKCEALEAQLRTIHALRAENEALRKQVKRPERRWKVAETAQMGGTRWYFNSHLGIPQPDQRKP